MNLKYEKFGQLKLASHFSGRLLGTILNDAARSSDSFINNSEYRIFPLFECGKPGVVQVAIRLKYPPVTFFCNRNKRRRIPARRNISIIKMAFFVQNDRLWIYIECK